MPPASSVMFLLDVDNTLLDNDRFVADLSARLDQSFGSAERERYWSIYEQRRRDLGYADYLGALQEFRIGSDQESTLLHMSSFLLDYPFGERLYPRALAAIEHLRTIGAAAIVSDGDIVMQPRKIQRSGLWDAVDGRVLVTLHKERMLNVLQELFPANAYVMIDDKPQLLAAMKRVPGARLTTVFVRQGHYAAQAQGIAIDPAPDMSIERIGDLCEMALPEFRDIITRRAAQQVSEPSQTSTSPEPP